MTWLAKVEGFRGLDLEIARHDIVLLSGPNGCGKTSLLRGLAGLDAPLRAARIQRRVPSLAYAPQDARDALIGLTVSGEFRLRRRGLPSHLDALAARASTRLSSGETRRVALATCEGASLLLLDEAAEGLDAAGRDALRALVRHAAGKGAVVMVDHGNDLASLATRRVHLGAGERAPLPALPRGEGITLEATPASVRGLRLPDVRLGPGFFVLRGPNGSGKSTLLQRLAGLLDAEGVRIAGAAPQPGVNVRLLLPYASDVLTRERVADECPPSPFVPEALRARHPLALSGGEAQRVALAKVFARDAPCYLLDEPEAHLDAAGRRLLVEEMAFRIQQGACILAATHDEELIALAHAEVRV